MNILVVNDDGLNSKSLNLMIKVLDEVLGYCYVSVPSREMSASSHKVTSGQNLTCTEINPIEHTERVILVNGSPADCVRLGLKHFSNVEFDLVISGLNSGENLGLDILYSGTVACSEEAAILNKPSIAFSGPRYPEDDYYDILNKVCQFIKEQKLYDLHPLLNINIPNKASGIMLCPMSNRITEVTLNPLTDNSYRINYNVFLPGNEQDKDGYLYTHNNVVITPLKLDRTDYEALTKITKAVGKVKL